MRKSIYKKVIATLLGVGMIATLAGCGDNGTTEATTEETTEATTEKTTEATTEEEKVLTLDDVINPLETDGKARMTIIGHASTKIVTAEGVVIYIDPFFEGDYEEPADIILITHGHDDHNHINKVTKKDNTVVIKGLEATNGTKYKSYEAFGIKIQSVPAYNDNHSKMTCVGFILEFDGMKVYHAGDTSKIDEMADLSGMGIDYALYPVDGQWNMDGAEATECANIVGAKHNIAIHTDGSYSKYIQENVDSFTPDGKLEVKHGETIELN